MSEPYKSRGSFPKGLHRTFRKNRVLTDEGRRSGYKTLLGRRDKDKLDTYQNYYDNMTNGVFENERYHRMRGAIDREESRDIDARINALNEHDGHKKRIERFNQDWLNEGYPERNRSVEQQNMSANDHNALIPDHPTEDVLHVPEPLDTTTPGPDASEGRKRKRLPEPTEKRLRIDRILNARPPFSKKIQAYESLPKDMKRQVMSFIKPGVNGARPTKMSKFEAIKASTNKGEHKGYVKTVRRQGFKVLMPPELDTEVRYHHKSNLSLNSDKVTPLKQKPFIQDRYAKSAWIGTGTGGRLQFGGGRYGHVMNVYDII